MNRTLLIALVFSSLVPSLTFGQPAGKPPPASPAPEVLVRLTGTLERRMAIGGETTGWVLRHGKDQRVELLLPAKAFAWISDGLVVSVSGVHGTRHYPERGDVAVFTVREISQVEN